MPTSPDESRTGPDTTGRVNRAIDHIVTHLADPLPLEVVASVAHFSPFHFHRVFKAAMGETLGAFVKRVRLERALMMLSRPPKRSLTDIALACGFGSSSDFSRSFKQRYGVPPSAFDLSTFRRERRGELEALFDADPELRHRIARPPAGTNPDGFEVQFRDLPERVVAYRRITDPFRPGVVDGAAADMERWADARGLADGQWLGYMWEDPEIVPLRDCRYDVGLVVDEVRAEGDIGRMVFPAMRVAEIQVRGPIDLEQRALDWLFAEWLPGSRCVPDDQPCFEAWIGRPFAHGLEHFELHVQLPVVPS
ncbi:MAG: GyrI-like domain-containing protein [Phycisphaerales bacterium]